MANEFLLVCRTCSEERQILASRLESVEAQANILKNRHPQLDFGVMEDELRRFEAERLELITGVEELKKQLEDSRYGYIKETLK